MEATELRTTTLSDSAITALNELFDAVHQVDDETGWTREEIMRYVDGCLLMNASKMRSALLEAGWREGKDGLWRTDLYGGSWKLGNAYRRMKREL